MPQAADRDGTHLRGPLSGDVEVDETFIGGVKTGGKQGRGAPGKAYVVIAVESKDKAFGRCRLQVVPKIDAENLGQFLHRHITPGSVVISDVLRSYPPAIADTYGHKPFNIKRSGLHAHEVLPGVHRVASLLKRWLAGTHQSGVSAEHLQAYLDVLLGWVGAFAMSGGGRNRQWWNGSLGVTATLPSVRFWPSTSRCMGIPGSAVAVSPT